MKRFAQQKAVASKARDRNVCMFHDCGTGKTLSGLDIIAYEKERGNTPALIVAPIRLIQDAWLSDAKEFHPELDIAAVYHKDPKKRKKLLYEDHEVQVTNPETFKNMFSDIQAKKFKVLIKDESSDLKSNTSQNTRATLAMAGFKSRSKGGVRFDHNYTIPIRHALTATPAPNNPSEYWAQVKFVTGPGDDVFSDNFYVFRSRYFYSIDIGVNRKIWKFRKQMFGEFCYKLSEVAHVCRKSDILDLPPQTHEIHKIELDRQEQAAYDSLKKDLVLKFQNETILATTALTEIMKLRQITSGFCYGEEGTHQIGMSKLRYLTELLAHTQTEQEIIWINFKYEAEMLGQMPNSAVLAGNIPMDRQIEIIKDFKAGNIQYLVANQQSVSHGLTFINSHYASYFSQNYSYELMKQSRDRQHRIGQVHECFYRHFIAEGTIDKVIYNATLTKEKMVNEFLTCLIDIQDRKVPDTAACNDIFTLSHNDMLKKETLKHLRGA